LKLIVSGGYCSFWDIREKYKPNPCHLLVNLAAFRLKLPTCSSAGLMMRFNILALSGGGFMGLYTAQVLAGIEARSGKPLRESFDLIAGTSIGGINALAIANGIPMATVVEEFSTHGSRIFSPRPMATNPFTLARDAFRFLTGSKYSGRELEETVARLVPPNAMIEDLTVRYIAPAVNLSTGLPHTFRTPHAAGHTNSTGLRQIDVAMATSAAPTLLPIRQIGDHYYSDGGTFANAPDLIAMHEAESLIRVPTEDIHILSVGTTTSAYDFKDPSTTSFGIREWLEDQRIIRMTLATQQQSAARILQARLGERYLRLDAAQGRRASKILGLDVATRAAQNELTKLAKQTIDRVQKDGAIDDFLSHQAPKLCFTQLPQEAVA
jgi:uncharacterized protein